MNEVTNWTELFLASLRSFGETFMGAIPAIIGAIVIFLLGWLFAKLLSGAVARVLKLMKLDVISEKIKVSDYLKKANITLSPSKLIGKFVYWIIMLIVFITASETLGWEAVSTEISKLISYIPKLFVAIVFFILGTYFATFIKDIIAGATNSLGISTGKIISNFVFYLLFIMILLTSLNQAGIDISIITSNLLLILGAILAAASISYGFASKDVLSNVLAGLFSKNVFTKGMKIEVDGVSGKIIDVNKIGISLEDNNGDTIMLPTHTLITQKVKIIKQS